MIFDQIKGLTLPEGKVSKVFNSSGYLLWRLGFTWEQYLAEATTTHYWNKYSLDSATTYTWNKYNVTQKSAYVTGTYNFSCNTSTEYTVYNNFDPITWTLSDVYYTGTFQSTGKPIGKYMQKTSDQVLYFNYWSDTTNTTRRYNCTIYYKGGPYERLLFSWTNNQQRFERRDTVIHDYGTSPTFSSSTGFTIKNTYTIDITTLNGSPATIMNGHWFSVENEADVYYCVKAEESPDDEDDTSSSNGIIFYYNKCYDVYKDAVYVDAKGSSAGTATSSSRSKYPDDGISGSYWYTYSKSNTTYSQGSTSYGEVNSLDSEAYPANSYVDGYWYVHDRDVTTYFKGNYIQEVTATEENAYPDDGYHSDGYWYVKTS